MMCMHTHPPRSRQSTKRDKASPPTTRTFFEAPVRMYCPAVMTPITKPLQAAVRSNPQAFLAPMVACNCVTGTGMRKRGHTMSAGTTSSC
eukprot:scaffold183667_cov18-Tisochrysis_lutea.AAC.3